MKTLFIITYDFAHVDHFSVKSTKIFPFHSHNLFFIP